jgi:hypothetical protein
MIIISIQIAVGRRAAVSPIIRDTEEDREGAARMEGYESTTTSGEESPSQAKPSRSQV